MKKPLLGKKIAVLVANGFAEKDLTMTQKALGDTGADLRVVSMNQGLVSSWFEGDWGLNYASDQVLSQALAVDFDMLIVPGGERSVQKLELTAHTRRFIGGFIDSRKPVAFYAEAMELLVYSERAEGMVVAGPPALKEKIEAAGATYTDEPFAVSGSVMTGERDKAGRESYTEQVAAFFIEQIAGETTEGLHEPVAA